MPSPRGADMTGVTRMMIFRGEENTTSAGAWATVAFYAAGLVPKQLGFASEPQATDPFVVVNADVASFGDIYQIAQTEKPLSFAYTYDADAPNTGANTGNIITPLLGVGIGTLTTFEPVGEGPVDS